MSSNHDSLVNAISEAVSKAPAQNRIAAMVAAARSQGYLVHVKGQASVGIGASAPLVNAGASINIPVLVRDNSGNRADKFGVSVSADWFDQSESLSIDTNGVNYDSLTAVDGPSIANLQSRLGLPFETQVLEDDNKLVFSASASAGVSVKNKSLSLAGGVDFVFADLSIEFVKADIFFAEEVENNIRALAEIYNVQNFDTQISIDQLVLNVKSHINDADFVANWRYDTLIELSKMIPGGEFSVTATPAFGGPGEFSTGLGDTTIAVGLRADGDYYLRYDENRLYSSAAANEASTSISFIGFNKDGITKQASTIYYEWKQDQYGNTVYDDARGITTRNFDGLQGDSVLDGRKHPVDQENLQEYIQSLESIYKANCFSADTPILMADGSIKPIQAVEVGDLVASFDPTVAEGRGSLRSKAVVQLFRSHSSNLFRIGAHYASGGHPFLADDGEFHLLEHFGERKGVDASGDIVSVTPDRVFAPEPIELFNFEVEDFHTYVANGLRVHNYSLKLDGSNGYVSFDSNGNAIGIVYDSSGRTIQVIDYRPGENYAALTERKGDAFTKRVWDKLDAVDPDHSSSALNEFNGLVTGKIPSTKEAREILLEFYQSDKRKYEAIEGIGSIGNTIGSILGNRISDDPFVSVATSAALATLGENLAEFIGNGFQNNRGLDLDKNAAVFDDIGEEFLANLKSAGIGAVSSFLTAELVNAIGLDGFAGELANSSAGYAIGQIVSNIVEGQKLFDGLSTAQLGNVVGGFLGAKLASEIVSFDTVGGQIGSAIGSALGTLAMSELAKAGTLLAGPVGAAIGAFVGFILGGLIGSIFGGTPRSGADSVWDSSEQKFVVANVWSKKGGSKDAARSVASAVSETFNSILSATGGTLLNPEAVQSGNYGMRKKDFVYRPYSTRDKDAITQRFNGKDAATQLIGYGVYQGLTDPDFQIAGGDIYVKRALYNTFQLGDLDPRDFDSSVLIGNISSAQQYESYLANSTVINALVSAEPNSVFAIETLLTLARAQELGLTRRAASDWFGGFSFLIKEAGTDAANVDFGFDYDAMSGQVSRLIGVGNYVLGDTIDIAGQTTIEAGAANDTMDLRTGKLTDQRGFTVNGHLNDDIAVSGSDFTAKTATLTISGSAPRYAVEVTVAADALAESTETFLASLSNAPGMQIMGGDAVATIVDGAAALPTLMVGDSYAWENDGYAVFRLSLSKAAASAITVDLALLADKASGGGVDFGSTAASNIQVSANGTSGWTNATSATFAAGTTQLFVRTAIAADNVANPAYIAPVVVNGQVVTPGNGEPEFLNIEGNERFKLQARATAGASALANGGQAVTGTGTIVDGAGTEPLVWIDNVVVDEASGKAVFIISRSRTMATSTTVTFATSDRRVLDIPVAATVDGGAGNDTIHASDLGDNLFGGAGDDTLYGGRLDDWLLGGDGNDVLDVGSATAGTLGGDGNYLNGGAGNDTLRGREGSDWLEGGDGIDTLLAGGGDDVLVGGAGNGDSLKGGTGSDQYVVRRGDGADVIDETSAESTLTNTSTDTLAQRISAILAGTLRPDWAGKSAGVKAGTIEGGDDAIVFGSGIDIGDIRLQRSGTSAAPGNDLVITVMETVNGIEQATTTSLTIKDWFANPFKRVEALRFADGNEVRIGDITSFIVGGSGNDVLIGTAGNDFVYGGAGDDDLFLLAGDDIGNGGTGDDMVLGDTGKDLLIGGLGDDELIGGAGADAITGDAGADDLYGGGDKDILSGGKGDGDVSVGGAGDDTFKYARGDGRDMVFDEFANFWQVVWTSAGGWNSGAGFAYNATTGIVTGPGGVVLRQNMGSAAEPDFEWVGRYDYDSATGTLKVFAPPANATTITANAGVDTIEFAPGINLQDVILQRPLGTNDLVLAVSRESEDLSNTSLVSDSITIKDWYLAPGSIEKLAFYQTGILDIAAAKTTLIAGTDGADGTASTPLAGTAIADWITGAAGDDVIAGGSGNDIIAGNSGFDTLKGEAGDDVLYGGTGDDTLDGGTGKDVLVGGSGLDAASYASTSAAVRVQLSASGTNTGDALGDEYDSIENVIGGSGADIIGGDDGQNELTGGRGNDQLAGGAGDDTYVWNINDGADVISEGAFVVEEAVTTAGALAAGYLVKSWANTGTIDPVSGKNYWRLQIQGPGGAVVYDNATYLYAAGTTPAAPAPTAYIQTGWLGGFARTNVQQVTRQRFDATVNGGDDEIEFGANVSLNDLAFTWSGDDLVISYGGVATSQVTIKGQRLANSAVETIKFSDGMAVSLASILAASSDAAVNGAAADDLLLGRFGTFADTLVGGAGDDVLVGYAGNDNLSGGDGDDTFEGGLGADVLSGGANSAHADSTDAGDTARYVRSAVAVTIDLNLAGAQTSADGSDALGDTLTGIENVIGSAYNDTIKGDGNANKLFGLAGTDTLWGGGGDDVLSGDDGNDTLYGEDGLDSMSGGVGNDKLYGGIGNDVLDGGDGADSLFGQDGDDVLSAGFGDDNLNGGNGNDILTGGDGNDKIFADGGDDTINGGAGNDDLNGSSGNDTYAFERSSGADTLLDTSGINTITFDNSVDYDELWLTRVGSDLRIAVLGTDASITVTGFFLTSGQSRVRSIQTTTHVLFLDHVDSLNLVTAMTAQTTTPAVTPPSMPAAIISLLGTYWHTGDKAAPTGPAAPRAVTLAEDNAIAIDGNYDVIDHDKNVVGYSMDPEKGPTKGIISAFNSTTGALTYTPFADVNGQDSFVVIATDADGQSVALPVNLTITPVNDAPRNIAVTGSGALGILESAPGSSTANGTLIGAFTSLDVEGDAVTYSLIDNAGGRFSMAPNGELRVLNASLLDREAAPSHTIRVRATDSRGAYTDAGFTVTVLNVNETPNVPTLSASSGIVDEYVAGASVSNISGLVARFTTSDPDGAPNPAIAFVASTGNPGGRFKIVGTEVQFAIEPDFEALANAGFTISDSDGDGFGEVTLTGKVYATDGQLSSAAVTFTVKVQDVNQQQTAIALSGAAASIAERDRVAAGTARPAVVLGTLSATDPDLVGQLTGQQTYMVFEDGAEAPSTRFAVNVSNQLVLLANQSLDYETEGASITLTVRATDKSANPLSLDRDFTFSITNVDDVVDGTSSADTLTGQQNRDILRGYAGADTISGLAGNDQLEGGDGNDTIYGGDGNDTLLGDAGVDKLYGDAGDDTLAGGDGNDSLDGGSGNDNLSGGIGNEGVRAPGTDAWRGFTTVGLAGGAGADVLNGGDGDDYLDGGDGADQLIGGIGFDGVTYAASTAAVTVNLATGAGVGGQAQGDTYSGIELVEGSNYADTLTGSAGSDVLRGGAGNDTLYGGSGADFLIGGAGDDTLDAQAGNDYLDGGVGNDILLGGADNDTYFVARSQGNDRIRNFDSTGTNFDHLTFDGTVLYTDIWFDRVDNAGTVNSTGNHLRLTLLGASGTEGSVTVENWFTVPDRTLPENYFKIDLISDGVDRAALPVNVDALVALMAAIPAGSRPTTQAQMASLRSSNASFRNGMEDYWARLGPPKISDTVAISGTEALDNGTTTISFAVRAWFDDDQGLGVTIPASNIDLALTASDGYVLSQYVTAINYGTPDANGNRTVTLTLAPNASTHLLPGGTLPLQLQAQIRGTTRTALDAGGIALSIAPTADTGSFTLLASAGGNAGANIAISLAADSPDDDGSETLDVLVKGLPSGYSLVNSAGAAVGSYESASGWWRLAAGQLTGLRLSVPAGRHEDAPLSFAVQTKDGNSTRTSAFTPLTVVVNGKPTNITLTGSVAENSSTGTLVGTLTGFDPDTAEGGAAPTSFQLLNNAGGRYVLDTADTRRLLVASGGANLNYEASNRDAANTITVRVFDAAGSYFDKSITVPVTNVNEQNTLPASYGWSVNENTGIGTLVGTIVASDPDSSSTAFGQQRYYFWNGSETTGTSADGRYTIDAVTGQIKTAATLNYEAGNTSVSYTVIARDNAGANGYNPQASTIVTIGINNLNEQNTLPASFAWSVNENLDSGTLVGAVTASDPDSSSIAFGQQRYYFLDGSTLSGTSWDGRYAVDVVTGQIRTTTKFNYEAGSTTTQYTVAARDNAGNTGHSPQTMTTVTINVNNVNEQNSLSGAAFYVNENVGTGTLVGAAAASDPDSIGVTFGQQRYWFWDGTNYSTQSWDGRYSIDNAAGTIRVNAALNREASEPGRNYVIAARDNQGNAGFTESKANFWIEIADVNEQHSLVSKTYNVNESNVALGPFVGVTATTGELLNVKSLMLVDPEQGTNITYRFSNGTQTSGAWTIDAASGAIWMTGSTNYEALGGNSTFNLSIEAIDNASVNSQPAASAALTITIKDVNEAPNFTSSKTYYGTDGFVVLKSNTEYWVSAQKNAGSIIKINGIDPEGNPLTYSVDGYEAYAFNSELGGGSEIDATGYPEITIASDGTISFKTPGESNGGEWEGGTRINGVRKTESVRVTFNLHIRDSYGAETISPFTIIFMRRNSDEPPIILDLDGDGVELVDYETSSIDFDMDQDGIRDRTGWAGPDDGFLALDRDGNSTIDNISEISFVSDLSNAVTDLEGLRAFDTNENGLLDANDLRFGEFLIWRDANQNGISESDELKSLTDVGIVQINLTLNETGDQRVTNRNVISATSDYLFADGTSRALADVTLAFDPSALPDDDEDELPTDAEDPGDGTSPTIEQSIVGEGESTIPLANQGQEAMAPTAEVTSQSDDGASDGDPVPPAIEEPAIAPPIVFDFDGDGAALVSLADSTTRFDMDGDGIADRTGWIESGDAFLALDRNGNGSIDGIAEISFVQDRQGAKTDLEGLVAFDNDGNGRLDGGDTRFVEFKLWFDRNGNGVTDAGELLSLAEAGITSLSLTGEANNSSAGEGENIIYNRAVYTLDNGTTGTLLDVGLAFKPLSALPDIEFQTSVWNGKSARYRISGGSDGIHVVPRDAQGPIASGAGLVGPAATLEFRNGDVGMLSAVILDLDGDGIEARRRTKTSARFDMDGDGNADDTGWVSGGDGLLVIDRDGDGAITGASEISFLSEKENAKSAWDGLSVLDNTRDGKINTSDARFGELRIWQDSNANGVTDQGELKSLADLGITEISLASSVVGESAKPGRNLPLSLATFTRENGVTATIGNVAFAFEPSSGQTQAQQAASRLAQAMSTFAANAGDSALSSRLADQLPGMDLLTASAA